MMEEDEEKEKGEGEEGGEGEEKEKEYNKMLSTDKPSKVRVISDGHISGSPGGIKRKRVLKKIKK